MVVVGRVGTFGQIHDGVFERKEYPGVYLKGKVQVERAVAGLLGVQVHLPRLAQGVRLDEVPLVVHVEAVVNGVVLQLRNVPGDIDDGHLHNANGRVAVAARLVGRWDYMTEDLLAVLHIAADAAMEVLAHHEDWSPTGLGNNQYHHDTAADTAAVAVLDAAGLGVFSEESGLHHPERPVLVVLDPVDGSTNASRGLPWWAISLCGLDDHGPLAAVVASPPTGDRFEAVRGRGARRNGRPIFPSSAPDIGHCVLAFNGYPASHFGWAQYRSFGAAALDLCAVACGAIDGFVDCSPASLAPWDYMGALLVCQEAGVIVREVYGRDLVVREPGERRTIVAAPTAALVSDLMSKRLQQP